MSYLIEQGYIPLEKSWHIRMATLDLLSGYDDSIRFFQKFKAEHPDRFGSDLEDMLNACISWNTSAPIKIEGGFAYRNLWYINEKQGLGKVFDKQRTLIGRDVGDTPEKLTMSLEELSKLKTSQWASVYILFNYWKTGKLETIPTDDYHINMTFDAVKEWGAREHGTTYEPQYDKTILRQANSYLEWMKTGKMVFTPIQPEDYCFARAFGLMTAEEGRARWERLKTHESDRIDKMEELLSADVITSDDHRVVQAIAMLRRDDYLNGKLSFLHPECVDKSWPQFWKFLKDAGSMDYSLHGFV